MAYVMAQQVEEMSTFVISDDMHSGCIHTARYVEVISTTFA